MGLPAGVLGDPPRIDRGQSHGIAPTNRMINPSLFPELLNFHFSEVSHTVSGPIELRSG